MHADVETSVVRHGRSLSIFGLICYPFPKALYKHLFFMLLGFGFRERTPRVIDFCSFSLALELS